jgi:hypothetical protein
VTVRGRSRFFFWNNQASAECTLGRIVGSNKGVYRVPLTTSDASGGLLVRAEEIKGDFLNEDTLTLTFKGVSLAAKDPYLQVCA